MVYLPDTSASLNSPFWSETVADSEVPSPGIAVTWASGIALCVASSTFPLIATSGVCAYSLQREPPKTKAIERSRKIRSIVPAGRVEKNPSRRPSFLAIAYLRRITVHEVDACRRRKTGKDD